MDATDEARRDLLLALRAMRGAYNDVQAKLDELLEDPASGLDPDQLEDFDERMIALEYLGSIRRGMDDLLRLLAATKGKAALAALVSAEG
jgi:hypothetical protein